jgi:hypothetical protein
VSLVADVRDFGAAIAHVANGDDGAWLELGASIVGFVPGGDIAKAAVKGATKATKAAAKAGAKAADNVGKVVKGSTAAAADGLSGAQKGAGKVNAPRGPPAAKGSQNPSVAAAAERGKQMHKARQYPPAFKKEVALPSGKRMDAYDETGREVRELKPNNARAIKRGKKQVDEYCRECDRVFGPGHRGKIETYE